MDDWLVIMKMFHIPLLNADRLQGQTDRLQGQADRQTDIHRQTQSNHWTRPERSLGKTTSGGCIAGQMQSTVNGNPCMHFTVLNGRQSP